MTKDLIIEKLKDIFMMVNGNTEIVNFTEDTDLRTGLGLNSVGMLYMIISIEESFSVTFDDVSMGDFVTVGDVVKYIEENQE